MSRTRQVRICSSICTSIRPPCRAPDSSHCDTVGHDRGAFDMAPCHLRPASRFSTDDVIYLAMPDRFRDGDAANNDPSPCRAALRRQAPLPWRRLHRHRREASVSQRAGHHGALAEPVYDNVNHLNAKERHDNLPITDYHGVRRRRFLRCRRAFGSGRPARARRGRPPPRDQGYPGPGRQPHGPRTPWVADPPTPTWFNGTEAKHARTPGRRGRCRIRTLAADAPRDARRVVHRYPARPEPARRRGGAASSRTRCGGWVCSASTASVRTWPYVPRAFWQRWMEALKLHIRALRLV